MSDMFETVPDTVARAIIAFLTARLDEDEQALVGATCGGRWEHAEEYHGRRQDFVVHRPTGDNLARLVYPGDARHAVRWQPSRVTAEIKAKRAIIARHTIETALSTEECRRTECCYDGCEITYCGGCGAIVEEQECPELRILAGVYADHPDHEKDWQL